MAVFIACLVLFLAMAGHSNAAYCVCRDTASTEQMQKAIDYACGNGANCNQILQNGACYNPNTQKDHCNYAVNSYYQNKGPTAINCDFSGTATVTPSPPTNLASTCSFPSSASPAGGTTGGNTSTTPISNTPGGTNSPGGTNTPAGSNFTPGSSTNSPPFGLGPSGTSSIPDGSGRETLHRSFVASLGAAILGTALIFLRV